MANVAVVFHSGYGHTRRVAQSVADGAQGQLLEIDADGNLPEGAWETLAGADAILMHSKRPTADQIVEFMQNWNHKCPVVIVPTTYYKTPTSVYEEAGVSLVIWANHMLRAAIKVMQQTAARIRDERSIGSIESEVVSVKEIFRLQNAAELEEAEKVYLPKTGVEKQHASAL